MITKNLERMKEISEELMSFSDRLTKITGTSYELNGNHLNVLYDDGEVEIIKGQFGAGSKIGLHTHEQTEHYLVVSGRVDLIMGNDRITLCQNDYHSIPSGVAHAMEAQRESTVLFIRVPASGVTTNG